MSVRCGSVLCVVPRRHVTSTRLTMSRPTSLRVSGFGDRAKPCSSSALRDDSGRFVETWSLGNHIFQLFGSTSLLPALAVTTLEVFTPKKLQHLTRGSWKCPCGSASSLILLFVKSRLFGHASLPLFSSTLCAWWIGETMEFVTFDRWSWFCQLVVLRMQHPHRCRRRFRSDVCTVLVRDYTKQILAR